MAIRTVYVGGDKGGRVLVPYSAVANEKLRELALEPDVPVEA